MHFKDEVGIETTECVFTTRTGQVFAAAARPDCRVEHTHLDILGYMNQYDVVVLMWSGFLARVGGS